MIYLSKFYESIFGSKTYKLSLDAACTCPNRDGSKGVGGCIFCSQTGSGDFATNRNLSIREQVEKAKERVESKLRGRSGNRKGKYIAYFQNFTSTYGDVKTLVQKYKESLECENVAGLAIATRPDCLNEEILSEIAKISETHFVQIELGLQTSNEKTGEMINRCYTNEDYSDALRRIKSANPNIHIVTHLIFGLPKETENDMTESVKFVVRENGLILSDYNGGNSFRNDDYFGIKITSLYIVENTRLAELYKDGLYIPLQKEEYFSLLKKTLPLLSENCVVHRLTGDPPKNILIAPQWTCDKKKVMNEIKNFL